MKIACLVPTYGRPRLLANALACFLAQDYPSELRRMYVLDDAGQIAPQRGEGWEVWSTPDRFPSLPAKYSRLIELAGDWPDAYCVWDDDDIYLAHHLSAHAHILANHGWSHPKHVWSLYTGKPELEPAAGRFHGSVAVRRDLLERVGGWPQTKRADFDQQFIARLAAEEPPGDPTTIAPPSYVFRWASTGAPHCQGLMSSPENEDWYERYQVADAEATCELRDKTDGETASIFKTARTSVYVRSWSNSAQSVDAG